MIQDAEDEDKVIKEKIIRLDMEFKLRIKESEEARISTERRKNKLIEVFGELEMRRSRKNGHPNDFHESCTVSVQWLKVWSQVCRLLVQLKMFKLQSKETIQMF
jgi:hypothetical protein